jgi:hypothetical protein
MVLVMAVPAGCSKAKHEPQPVTRSATVGPSGGTFEFGDTAITVPSQAVTSDVSLSVSEPTVVRDPSSAPLGVSGALRFDVALDGGRTQPAKPLELTWRLPSEVGAELAAGKVPLLYSAADGGQGYELVGASVSDGRLTAQLTHLSLKWLTIFDPHNFVSSVAAGLDAGPVMEAPPADCALEVDLPGRGKVSLGGSGWSRSRGTPFHPCLKVQGDGLLLRIRNNAFVNWPVVASPGVTLKTGYDSVDDHAVAAIVAMVTGQRKDLMTLPRGANVLAVIPPSAVPATLTLEPNPGPFLAEVVWFALNFLVGLMIGSNPDETKEIASKIMDSIDVVRCIQDYVQGQRSRINGEFTQAVVQVTKALGEKCGEKLSDVAAALHGRKAPTLWGEVWHRVQTVVAAIFDGLPIVLAGLNGAALNLAFTSPTVTVQFASAPPPAKSSKPPAPPQPPKTSPAPPPPAGPSPVVHYDCANDNSNIGKYVPAGHYWQNPFTSTGHLITGGFVLIGANTDGIDHRARVGIYSGSGIGTPLATTVVNVTGYDGESFTLSPPLAVQPGQQLYLSVVGIGNFTAYDNRSGCFIGRVDGTS